MSSVAPLGENPSSTQRLQALSADKMELVKLLLERKSRQKNQIPRHPRGDGNTPSRLPTSWAQQRLWFIDQLEGGSPAYHVPLVLRLRGALDTTALERSLDALIERHETLRTVFLSEEGEPRQEILPAQHVPLPIVDLSPAECNSRLSTHLREEAQNPFNLRNGPLIRAQLLKLEDREHLLLITMHHIISDGWSLGVFMRELGALYAACHEGHSSPLAPLPIQYADYAQWQRTWLQGDLLEKQLNYWRTHLTGAPPELKLPLDRPRPAIRSYEGSSLLFALDNRESTALRAFALEHGLTPFMVLYAAWTLLLSRLSAQDDIVVGTPVANRQRPELENLLGFLVNTLALRVHVRNEMSVQEFLLQIREATLGAYDHQDVPFEQVVEAVQPERSLSRHPIFQTMLAMHNAPRSDLSLPGLIVTAEEDEFAYCKFDLVLSLEELSQEISGTVSFSSRLFSRETIERWMGYYRTLLKSLMKGIHARLSDLEMLSDTEIHRVTTSFNETTTDYPKDKLLHELFESQVRRNPNHPAVTYADQALTYAELNARANQLARYLMAQKIEPDQLVGLSVERGLEMVVALLGIWKSGGAYVPLDPDYPVQRLAHILDDATPRLVLTQQHLRGRLPAMAGVEVVALDSDWSAIAAYDTTDPDPMSLRPHHLAYVIYTSGSTGRPKGVMVEHRNVASLWQGLEHLYHQAQPCQRVAVNASFNFDASVKQFIQLLSGRTLVLVPQEVRLDPTRLVKFIDENRVDCIDCTPSQLRAWITAGLINSGSHGHALRMVLVGGEAIDAELWQHLAQSTHPIFQNVYGPTESTVDTTAACLNGDTTLPHIGRPMENRRVYVLDASGRPVPIGVAGEITIGGAGVARGYWRRPELTAQRFIPDPFTQDPHARMYRSGDQGRWRPDGTLEYLGRIDDQVKLRGFRIELGEIDAQLRRHPGVNEAVVVVREDRPGEQCLVAYMTPRGEQILTTETLQNHLKSLLPDYMVPSAIVVLDAIPLTPSGKLDRRALPAPTADAFASAQYEAPQGETEQTLAKIWEDVLFLDRVGRHDNFFALGGHSLSGMKLTAKVTQRCGISLTPMTVFQYPTIKQMAVLVDCIRSDTLLPDSSETETAMEEAAI